MRFEVEILRCAAVRFSAIANPSVRFGAVIYPAVRFGAVLQKNPTVRFRAVLKKTKSSGAVRCCDISYGAVRCGFQKSEILRFVAVFRYRKNYCAVRCCDISYGAVRRGSTLNVFLYGAAPLSVGKTVQHRFFSTVHSMNYP